MGLSLIFFAAPLGLGNSLVQPIAAVLLLPFMLISIGGAAISVSMIVILSTISIIQVIIADTPDSSWFQFFRSAVPFFYSIAILSDYSGTQRHFAEAMHRFSFTGPRVAVMWIYAFAAGQLVQIAMFAVGIPLANVAFGSTATGRVFLVQTSSSLLLFFFGLYSSRPILVAMVTIVLLASGSKTIIATMLILFLIAMMRRISSKILLYNIVSIIALVFLVMYVNPTAIQRLSSFVNDDKREDITRTWEIQYAQSAFNSGVDTIVFGNGFAVPLTPGISSRDPRWTQNSKFDIENGYWSALAKLGIVGTTVFALLFLRMPRNVVFLSVIAVELVTCFGSSGLLFTNFDGPYLLVWSIVINYLLAQRPSLGAILSRPPSHFKSLPGQGSQQ